MTAVASYRIEKWWPTANHPEKRQRPTLWVSCESRECLVARLHGELPFELPELGETIKGSGSGHQTRMVPRPPELHNFDKHATPMWDSGRNGKHRPHLPLRMKFSVPTTQFVDVRA
jgi:hypothetical protein